MSGHRSSLRLSLRLLLIYLKLCERLGLLRLFAFKTCGIRLFESLLLLAFHFFQTRLFLFLLAFSFPGKCLCGRVCKGPPQTALSTTAAAPYLGVRVCPLRIFSSLRGCRLQANTSALAKETVKIIENEVYSGGGYDLLGFLLRRFSFFGFLSVLVCFGAHLDCFEVAMNQLACDTYGASN